MRAAEDVHRPYNDEEENCGRKEGNVGAADKFEGVWDRLFERRAITGHRVEERHLVIRRGRRLVAGRVVGALVRTTEAVDVRHFYNLIRLYNEIGSWKGLNDGSEEVRATNFT